MELKWFDTVVFLPVLPITNVVQVPGWWQDSSQASSSDTAQFTTVVICHPHLNYGVWLQLKEENTK